MVVVVVVVVVVFVVVVVLVALHHRNHKAGAAGRAGHLLPLQAGQYGGHRGLLLLLLGVGLGLGLQGGFGRGQGLSGFGPHAFAVAVLQRVLVVAGGLLGLVRQVVNILASVGRSAATVQDRLQGRVVTVTFSGFAASAAAVVASAPFVGPFGGFEELSAFASRLCGVIAVADDLRAAVVDNLGFGFLGARAALALRAPTVRLLRGEVRGGSFKSGGVVLDTSQVQVVIPPLCVLVHTVMLALSSRRLIALPFAADVGGQPLVS